MIWGTRIWRREEEAGARFRRVHEEWLTWALSSGRVFPTIPTRRVSDGGYDTLRRRPGGMARATAWWLVALARLDER